jgi:hypothetical protein
LMRRCTVAPQDPSSLAEPVPARRNDPILIAKAQPTTLFAQPCRQLCQNLGTVLENPDLADLAAAPTLGNPTAIVALCTANPTYVIVSIRPVSHA